MNQKISKRHNSYRRIDGVVVGWERGHVGEGQKVHIVEADGKITTFNWRSPKDPTAGDQVTVVLPEEGVSAKQDRAIMILNQTTGETHREINAHDPRSARNIMARLIIWEAIALCIVSTLVILAAPEMRIIFMLAAGAILTWRLAIATSDLRQAERAAQRKIDEEAVCTDIAMSAWEGNIESRLPRMDVSYAVTPKPGKKETK